MFDGLGSKVESEDLELQVCVCHTKSHRIQS
jgi:hypothetical protein